MGITSLPNTPPTGPRKINLEDILTPSRIPSLVSAEDIVTVIGGSHSEIQAVRNLLTSDSAPQKVINIYRTPLLYGEYLADGRCVHANTGLKGKVADWARENLESGHYEDRLERIQSSEGGSALEDALSRSTAFVLAVGFERSSLPEIVLVDGSIMSDVRHNKKNGEIFGARGLWGFGIAFPEEVTDPSGQTGVANVGILKFSHYIQEVLSGNIPSK